MGPAKKKRKPAARAARVMPSRVSKLRGVINLRKAVEEDNKRLSYRRYPYSEPEDALPSQELGNSLRTKSLWSKRGVRQLLPEPHPKPTFPNKKICSAAAALGVTPEMVRCGAIKVTRRRMVDDRPLSCGDAPPVIALDDYVARKFGGEVDFWMELSVRKVMSDLSKGIADHGNAARILGVSTSTLQKKLKAFKALNESVTCEEPERDSDGDIVCHDIEGSISDYDVIRMRNIKAKNEMFKSLGIDVAKSAATRKRGYTWRTIHMKNRKEGMKEGWKLSKRTVPPREMPQRVTKLSSAFMRELKNGGNGVRVGDTPSRSYPLPAADEMQLDEFITLDSDYLKTRHGLRWLSVKTYGNDSMRNPYSLDYADGITTSKNIKLSKSELTACSIYGDCSQPRLNLVSVGDKNGVVSLWTPETTVKLKTHSESISSLEFYGSQVVTASPDGHIRSIDLERLVLQDVFDATKHFSDTTSNPGMITWHKAKSNTQVYVENGNGTILLYDVMANTSVTISEDGIGRPVALNPGNEYEVCIPRDRSIAFVDTRMIKSKPYTKIYELEQRPTAVEYSDFTEKLLVSLLSDGSHEGMVVVWGLDSGVVEAKIPAAINNAGNAAAWHPDKADIIFLPYAYTNSGQYESTLAVADLEEMENLTVFGETFSNSDFSLSTAANCPMITLLNSNGKGSLKILANHDIEV